LPPDLLAQRSLSFPRYGVARSALGKLVYWYYRLFRAHRSDTPTLERIGDMTLLVLPGVLNPRLMRSGAFFASRLGADLITPGAEVLDMGTGSGVCAIAAARRGARVAAVDINPVAVRCTEINARVNALEDRIEVLRGDLFAPVQDRRFDLVLFNPPFIRGIPRDDADRAWRSTDVAERFAAGLSKHLRPSGFALVVLSTFGDAAQFLRQFHSNGFEVSVVATRDFVNERLSLLRLTQAPGEAAS
jgi:release factor glutamine methyltransferase